MMSELTNLLSFDRIRAFRRDYFLRLATLTVFALSVLIVVHGILLAPSYFYANEQAGLYRAHLAGIQEASERDGEASVAKRFTTLNGNAARALELVSAPSASAVLRAVLALPRPGVAVTRFTFAAPIAPGEEGRVTVSGVASTRDALRSYHVALESLAFVSSAELPLGSYASERAIPFTITLMGSLQP